MGRDRVDAQVRKGALPPQREALVIGEDDARFLTRAALADAGLCATDAQQVADALVDTSLRGIDAHGLRLLPQYLDELATGVADATGTIRVLSDRGAGLLIDAGGALGVVAGLTAAQLAAQRATKFGVAAVGVRNSNDFGAASVYTRQLARDGLVGIVVTATASRLNGGVQPLFGTDPIDLVEGLSAAVALLGSVLTGASLDGPQAGQSGGVGHLIIALDPGAIGGHADFGAGLADLLHADAPGDPQRERMPQAIPVDPRTADVLSSLAGYLGVPGPRSVFAA